MEPMDESSNRYAQRGVSSSKKEVHDVVDHMDKGLFEGSFCKVTEDLLTADPNRCNVIHSIERHQINHRIPCLQRAVIQRFSMGLHKTAL